VVLVDIHQMPILALVPLLVEEAVQVTLVIRVRLEILVRQATQEILVRQATLVRQLEQIRV
jgi:hypothetical protein